ncbi:DUF1800 domain-containing protein [Tenacibaculum sp. M341]|uniref:DUF1800 domain-containing protein n=1 Tax=Tenacibaculum sp. M341 TaxID=2530339 RepID=UPI0010512908|nr:DUF1800 domain-containing protein [Tenacibaculum sp. M341]TCI92303.1 DUF1800 domain-containing protein [Tenacibaculum sp. M341]
MKTTHVLHLYNRIGFGITPNELNALKRKSKKEIVEDLFSESKQVTPLEIDLSFLNNVSKATLKNKKRKKELMKLNRKKVKELNKIWLNRIFNPKEVLREKMTLFWANHFVCKDNNTLHILKFNNLLRAQALGNFRTFTKLVSKESSMLKYLNNKQNRKNSPNENFARELMELFTLGQGNYTERDIKESARAFTGYNHNFKGDFKLKQRQHDTGEKSFFNEKGNFNGDDIIDIILKQTQCAQFICKKLYAHFVNEQINEDHVNEMVAVFYPNYNIETVIKHVLLSDWFYDANNIGNKIKSPIDLLASIHKIVPFSFEKKKQHLLVQRTLGQTLLNPPNVAGWKEGKGWIDSNTIITRLRLPSILLNNAEINYSEKGDFKSEVVNLKDKKLRKRAYIKTIPKWTVFEKNYQNISNKELLSFIITSTVSENAKNVLNELQNSSKKDFCIQLLSLPEFQLC